MNLMLLMPILLAPADLPTGNRPSPLRFDHFPDALHAVVWRNRDLVPTPRLAATLGATPAQVDALAASMGLPETSTATDKLAQSLQITIIRRNWHLLPYEQLLTLLDTTPERLAFTLREDDFLFEKLGGGKPTCPPVRYAPPVEAARRRAGEIRALVAGRFGPVVDPPLGFVDRLAGPTDARPLRLGGGPRFVTSYFGSYGDPLAGGGPDPYPDGLLARLAAEGVNGVWLHVLLRQLAPGGADFPEFGEGGPGRLRALRGMVARASKHGIEVYLYLNEPRSMPVAFFEGHPGSKGVAEGDHSALCTSDPRVLRWLAEAVGHVAREVPGLGGVFTITASENLTHCASHGHRADCPRCAGRTDAAIIGEVNRAVAEGLRTATPAPRLIAWDWGWANHGDAPEAIDALPAEAWLMSVSEWGLPIVRGGVASRVGEYSLSAVGPGPRAIGHWARARGRGLKTVAKVQANATWELSPLPWLPLLDLVADHAEGLARQRVDGAMLSWSVGGYPSPNLRVFAEFAANPRADKSAVLDAIAAQRYGPAAAPAARRAWSAFASAFRLYPYHIEGLYKGPQQLGPANLLWAAPTGRPASMLGFPHDDLDGWRGPYPREVYASQFEAVARGWDAGVAELAEVVRLAADKGLAEEDRRLARAAGIHLRSVANQARYIIERDARDPSAARRLDDEARLARELYDLRCADSRIGFEASNQYYYMPNDLIEKVICCESMKTRPGAR